VICQLISSAETRDRDSAETEFTECSCADGWRSPVSTVTASQPASLVVSAATAPAAHETESAGRLEGGRRGVRAHHFRVTHQLACHRERPVRPPDQRPPHHHHALLLINTLITIHAHKAPLSQHHATPSPHLPLLPPALLPHCCHRATASPCALLPGDNRPRTPRAAASTPRRCPRPRRGSRPPSHTLCPTHRDCPAWPCRQRQPRWILSPPPIAIQFIAGRSRPSALLPLGPCAAGPPAHPGPRSRRRRAQRKCPLLALGALALPEQSATCVGYSLPPPPAPRTSIDAARVASSARRARQQSAGTLAKHPRAHCSPRATAPRSLGNLAGCVGRCRGCDGWL